MLDGRVKMSGVRMESVNLFLVTMNHNGFKLMARDGISYQAGHRLDSPPRISLSVHNETHFVRTMPRFKHITQTS